MDDDVIRPTEQAFKAMFERGYYTWSHLYEIATSEHNTSIQTSLSQIHTAFPHHPRIPSNIAIDGSFSNMALVKGTSSWKTALACDLPSFDQELFMPVADESPVTLIISDTQHPKFNSAQLFDENNDHTAILILAWTYILSARWAEFIPDARGPEYTEYMSDWANMDGLCKPFPDGSANTIVHLGEVDDTAARWWSAVLSIEGGWNATIQNDRGNPLHAPWFTKIVSNNRLTLTRISNSNIVPNQKTAPPFATSLRYLSDYCQLHGLDDQNQAALAATLLIPAAKYDNRPIHISSPRFRRKETGAGYPCENLSWTNNRSQLDKLLTLSCNAVGVKALLNSLFFEPGVDCNICGAWLQGTFEFLNSVKDQHVLLGMLIARDPPLAFLWIGAFVTGFHTQALQEARGGWWRIDLHAAAWTDTLMSFIQEPVSNELVGMKQISRADECRLLFLSHDISYTNTPLFPFAPFGFTALEDTDLDVREHAGCATGHCLQYESLKWLQNKSNNTDDEGTAEFPKTRWRPKNGQPNGNHSNVSITYENLDQEEDEISEFTTRNIFTWLREEGYPIAEKSIREHEWINNFESDDEEEYVPTGDSLSSAGGRLHGWLIKSMTTRAASL